MSQNEQTKTTVGTVVHDWTFPGLLRRAEAEYGLKISNTPASTASDSQTKPAPIKK